MIRTEKLSDSQSLSLDKEFEEHIRNKKTISVEDKQFWSKLR